MCRHLPTPGTFVSVSTFSFNRTLELFLLTLEGHVAIIELSPLREQRLSFLIEGFILSGASRVVWDFMVTYASLNFLAARLDEGL